MLENKNKTALKAEFTAFTFTQSSEVSRLCYIPVTNLTTHTYAWPVREYT